MRQPYPHYRNSLVERIGEVPRHWDVWRMKVVASINDENFSDNEDPLHNMSYIDIGSVDAIDGITKVEQLVFEDAPTRARRLVREGDTIVSTVRTYLRAIAPVIEPPDDLVVSTGFAVVRPFGMDEGYCSWVLREYGFVEEIVACSVGVSYPAINASELGLFQITVPPLDEQHAIAAFLDHETGRIDNLLNKNQILLERLAEYCTALISQTVTKGLPPDAALAAGTDPSPRLKSSEVEWIGDIPEHWEVQRIKNVAAMNPSKSELRTTVTDETSVVFLPMENVEADGKIDQSEIRSVDEVWEGYTYFRKEDVLVAKITPCFENGKGAYLNSLLTDVGFGSTEFHVLRAGPSVLPSFLYHVTASQAFRAQGTHAMTGAAGQKRVPSLFVEHFSIPVPPIEEQRAIVAFLEGETNRIDSLTNRVQTAIERLQEYRTALITAAVTGKIDVRDLAS